MEILSVARTRSAFLRAALALCCLAAASKALAGEAFDAMLRGKIMETGATSICDFDIPGNVGRTVKIYGNAVATRDSLDLLSDPRCPSIVIGLDTHYYGSEGIPLRLTDNSIRKYLFSSPPGAGLLYCACYGVLRETSVKGKYYLLLDDADAAGYLPPGDAPSYPAKIVLDDGRIVPGPEFLVRRATKPVTREYLEAASKPGFIPPSPW